MFFLPEQLAPNIGLACTDSYAKYPAVVPRKTKQPLDVITGIQGVLSTLGAQPHIVCSGDDGNVNRRALQAYLANANMNHIVSRSHPHYVERYSR